jgi:hypothetical protein
MEYIQVPEGVAIFKEGDESNGKMYLVYSGELLVVSSKMAIIPKDNIKDSMKPTNTKSDKLDNQEEMTFSSMVENF